VKEATSIPDVVCAIIRHPENPTCCLVAQRSWVDANLPGKWEFPGGKVETGESCENAILREIREELHGDIKVEYALTPVIHHYDRFSIRLIPFVCTLVSEVLIPLEHEGIQWVGADELNALDWAPADLPILSEWISRCR